MLSGVYDKFQEWVRGTVWIYSDPHFGDAELRKGIPDRPSDDELVRRINAKVGKHDTLIILGDVGNLDYIRKLRGHKILIMGNHDKGKANYQAKSFIQIYSKDNWTKEEVYKDLKKKFPNYNIDYIYETYEFHEPFVRWTCHLYNNLFDEVYEGPLMIGEKIILSHEPIPNLTWAINLHGHVHDKNASKLGDNYYNFCADVINYEPVNLNKFLKNGCLSKIDSLHRKVIDKASNKKEKKVWQIE